MVVFQSQRMSQAVAIGKAISSSLMVAIALGSTNYSVARAQVPAGNLPPSESDSPGQFEPDTIEDPWEDSDEIDPEAQVRTDVSTDDRRFDCQYVNEQYTVTYHPDSRPGEAFPWAIPQALGGGWTPEERCVEISRRLEEYRADGLLEIQTSTENGYDIVCATTEDNPQCRIVFTVPPGQDPLNTRDAVFANLALADSGEMTQGVNTFVGGTRNDPVENLVNLGLSIFGGRTDAGSSGSRWVVSPTGINLKPYLDAADRGTGAALIRGIPSSR